MRQVSAQGVEGVNIVGSLLPILPTPHTLFNITQSGTFTLAGLTLGVVVLIVVGGLTMARNKKPVYEFELDDTDDEQGEEDLDLLDEETTEIMYEKYMEDISEILSNAYEDISVKVRNLMEAIEK